MTEYYVGTGPITGAIYAGRMDESGWTHVPNSEVTDQAIVAVADHVQQVYDGALEYFYDGPQGENLKVKITVKNAGGAK